MPRQLALFLTALQMLTRVPTPTLQGFQPEWTARSARYFPLVGALIGVVAALVLAGAAQLWSGALPALLAVAAAVLLTGAFHEDGLADAVDGLGDGQTPERRLEIMKDSRIGSYGALALGFVTAAKVLALSQVPLPMAVAALVAAHAGARAAAVVPMRLLPYAGDRAWAKLKPAAEGVTGGEMATALGIALLAATPALLSAPAATLSALAAGAGAAGLMSAWARHSLGGWVGDTLGANEQLFEAAFLLTFAAIVA